MCVSSVNSSVRQNLFDNTRSQQEYLDFLRRQDKERLAAQMNAARSLSSLSDTDAQHHHVDGLISSQPETVDYHGTSPVVANSRTGGGGETSKFIVAIAGLTSFEGKRGTVTGVQLGLHNTVLGGCWQGSDVPG
jgi:hypothetical protein